MDNMKEIKNELIDRLELLREDIRREDERLEDLFWVFFMCTLLTIFVMGILYSLGLLK